MHTTKTLILMISMIFCLNLAASQEGQGQQAATRQGYFAWFKSLFTRQKPTIATPTTISAPEESKPVSQAQTTSTPAMVSGSESSKPLSQAQKILQTHYASLTNQLNETPSAAKDLSFEEIRQLALIDLDADIADLEQKIDSLGDTQVHKDALALISNLSELVEHWRKEDTNRKQVETIKDYQAKINSFRNKLDPSIYRYMQRLSEKIIEQAIFINDKIAAIPLPNRGAWKEVYTLVQNICNANNMLIPKLYYGNDGKFKGTAAVFYKTILRSGRPVIFIPQRYIKSSEIEKLKGAIVHELGHLYYGDINAHKRDFLKSVKSSGKLSDDFWQKHNYQKEYAADIFAAFYGFGEPSAEGQFESHIDKTIFEEIHKKLEEEAEKSKEPIKEVAPEKKKELETHPTSASRLKNLLEAGKTKPGFINVPHMDLSTRPFKPANRISVDRSPYYEYISQKDFEKMKGPVWTQRPYVGPKKIDISATPIYKRPTPLKQTPGQPDYSFRTGLQNVAAKATYILKKIPK